MNFPRRLGLLFVLSLSSGIAALANCGSDSTGATPSLDASIDAHSFDTDSGSASDTGSAVDAGSDAPVVPPVFDDAGCPVPTGVTGDLATAGLPTTGVALWLRGDLGVATINNVSDGGTVCRWDDLSGNGNSVTPSTSARATKLANGIGGAPAVYFGATGQNLTRPGTLGIPATSARTVAIYAKAADTTHRLEYFFQGVDGTPGTYFGLDQNTFQTAGNLEGVYVTNNSFDSDIATTTNARSQILSISSFAPGGALPGVLTYSVDGVVHPLKRLAVGLGTGVVEDFSGANFTSVGYGEPGFTGAAIGELIVYSRELTPAERAMVDAHFNARYK